MRQLLGVFILASLGVLPASAAEAWLLFGSAQGPIIGCSPSYVWSTQTLFHNTASFDRQITIRHQSAFFVLPDSITMKAGESLPLNSGDVAPPGLAAVEVDVPQDVIIESRLEYRNVQPCSGIAPAPGPSGKIALPTFRLVLANEPQRHFGLDLGNQSSRVNVGVYNGGSSLAFATIEVRRPSCDGTARTVVPVPADTVVQVRAEVPPVCAAPSNLRTPFWVVNATVTVDQPSFSYATTVSNTQSPNATFGVGIQ